MTATFKDFGEAAKLYAQYKPVVDEMQKACEGDITAFHSEVQKRMEAAFPGSELGDEVAKNWRSWWIKLPSEKPDADVPYVYTPIADTRIVAERRLWVGILWETKDGSAKERINAAAATIKFPPHCRTDLTKSFFAMTIELGADPVTAVVEPLQLLIAAIHEVRVSIENGRSKRAR